MRKHIASASLITFFSVFFLVVSYYEHQLHQRDVQWNKLLDGDYVRITEEGPQDSILGLMVTMRRADAFGWYVVSSRVGNSKRDLAETVLRDYRRSKVAEFRSIQKNAREKENKNKPHNHKH